MHCILKARVSYLPKSAVCWLLAVGSVVACGPWFPNRMLTGSDDPLYLAPVARFDEELERIKSPQPEWRVKPLEDKQDDAEQSAVVEAEDLRMALKKKGLSSDKIEKIAADHLRQRHAAAAYFDAPHSNEDETASDPKQKKAEPEMPRVVDGLPDEFAEYFKGWLAYRGGDLAEAETRWAGLLKRPADERRYKTVWAAYMLGRLKSGTNPDEAVGYYLLTRALAKEGFHDHLGLAGSSLGWEAQVHLRQRRFRLAVDRYLDQLAAGDYSALLSLRLSISAAFASGDASVAEFASDPRLSRVVTAHFISSSDSGLELPTPSIARSQEMFRWLEAVENAGSHDVELADQLGLAAYQAGEMDIAQRWVDRAGKSAMAQWLRAKLLFRAGKVDAGSRLLASLVRQFPVADRPTNTAPAHLADTVFFDSYIGGSRLPGIQLRAELGALNLKRGEYIHAIDVLLAADYWSDAAYIAERVLTIQELKAYVDRSWPEADPAVLEKLKIIEDTRESGDSALREAERAESTRTRLRDLLARRLTRESRGVEAEPYRIESQSTNHQELMAHLQAASDETLSTSERARHWWQAALITRTNGMELMGTEGYPDNAEYGGDFEADEPRQMRVASASLKVLAASDDELARIQKSAPNPNERFHYRYQAASLAWAAARLMPNNDPETAMVLYTAGSWLKNRDPKAADVFYKSLVRRCRKTELGHAADVQRWFPDLDDRGKPLPRSRKKEESNESRVESDRDPSLNYETPLDPGPNIDQPAERSVGAPPER